MRDANPECKPGEIGIEDCWDLGAHDDLCESRSEKQMLMMVVSRH